jgi:glycosyltransferase involved in cell wall biosynthesis
MNVSVIIPVFNEGRYIVEVLDRVLGTDVSPHRIVEVIVAEDASTDETLGEVERYARAHPVVRVIAHARNRGKTAAIRSALPLVTGQVVIIQDADLEYNPSDYPALIEPIADGRARVVYGSRFLRARWPEGMGTLPWVANRIFTLAANLLHGARITDEGTAYKVFDADLIKDVPIKANRFEFCPEVTARVLRMGERIVEVPIAYAARSRGEGKKPGVRDGLAILWTLVKYRFVS